MNGKRALSSAVLIAALLAASVAWAQAAAPAVSVAPAPSTAFSPSAPPPAAVAPNGQPGGATVAPYPGTIPGAPATPPGTVNVELGAIADSVASDLHVDATELPGSVPVPAAIAARVCAGPTGVPAATCTATHGDSALSEIVQRHIR